MNITEDFCQPNNPSNSSQKHPSQLLTKNNLQQFPSTQTSYIPIKYNNSHLLLQINNNKITECVSISLAEENGQAYVKKTKPGRRRLREKNSFLYKLGENVADFSKCVKLGLRGEEIKSILEKIKNNKSRNPKVCRIRNKLELILRKKEIGLKLFDFDSSVNRLLKQDNLTFSSVLQQPLIKSVKSPIPLKFKIYGTNSVSSDDVIWVDYETKTPAQLIFNSISSLSLPIKYIKMSSKYISQVNSLLCKHLYPGIDVKDEFNQNRFGILALFGTKVVGCVFFEFNVNLYCLYLCVDSGFQQSLIGSWLMYFGLNYSSGSKDCLLHVQCVNWRALKLYSKFGFKVEKFLLGFYDRYVPWELGFAPGEWNSSGSRHAFLMRRRG